MHWIEKEKIKVEKEVNEPTGTKKNKRRKKSRFDEIRSRKEVNEF